MRLGQFVVVALIGTAAFTAYRAQGEAAAVPASAASQAANGAAPRNSAAASLAAAARRKGGALTRSGSAAPAGAPAGAPSPRNAAPAVAVVPAGPPGVDEVVGRAVSRLVGGGVRAMTATTARHVESLSPRIAATAGEPRLRADALVRQIRTLEGETLSNLEAGRPVAAIRSAMRGRNLVNDVRGHVREASAQ